MRSGSVSVAAVALAHGINATFVQNWHSQAQALSRSAAVPIDYGFVPVSITAQLRTAMRKQFVDAPARLRWQPLDATPHSRADAVGIEVDRMNQVSDCLFSLAGAP